jgi:hypothetical protein
MGINTASHVDNDFGSLFDVFKTLNQNLEEIVHRIRATQVDIDIYRSESGATGIISLSDQVRQPFKLTDIIAQWFATEPGQSQVATGNTGVAPAAGTVIVTGTLSQAGTYTLMWSVGLSGTATAADADNFGLYNGAILLAQSVNPGAVGVYPQETVVENLNLNQLTIKVIGAGSAAAVYEATLVQTPEFNQTVTLTIGNDRTLILDPTAGQFVLSLTNGMQVDNHSKIQLQISPAAPCFFEVLGSEDYRKIDRQ